MRVVLIVAVVFSALAMPSPSQSATPHGDRSILAIRIRFADVAGAPSEATVEARLGAARNLFRRFSFGRLRIEYDITPLLTLPRNRSTYDGSALAGAAEAAARSAGFNPTRYDIVGFYYSGGPVGAHAIVGGRRYWAPGNGGATMHEVGHTFGYSHQGARNPTGDRPLGPGVTDRDPFSFMTTGTIDPEPFEKYRCRWITDRAEIRRDGSFSRRLYNFDQADVEPGDDPITIRVRRHEDDPTHYWLGYRSRLLGNIGSSGSNHRLRRGLVVYWDRGGGSSTLLDLHASTENLNDHSLQPGETYADVSGGVFLTNLGRRGSEPNEYLDLRIIRGSFPGNEDPASTWDLPAEWFAGVPLTITIEPNDPEGHDVACRWHFRDRTYSDNHSGLSRTHTWDEEGRYRVTVLVSDMHGGSATLDGRINIRSGTPPAPDAGLPADAGLVAGPILSPVGPLVTEEVHYPLAPELAGPGGCACTTHSGGELPASGMWVGVLALALILRRPTNRRARSPHGTQG